MSGQPDYMTSQRKRLNDASKYWAHRDGEPWTSEEEDLLLSEWIDVAPDYRDEVTVSQVLERTIESCRVRCEQIRARLGISITRTTSVTVHVVEYVGHHDDPDDQWWSPGYYNR